MKDFSLESSINGAIRLHPNFDFLNKIVDLGEPTKKLPTKIPESNGVLLIIKEHQKKR